MTDDHDEPAMVLAINTGTLPAFAREVLDDPHAAADDRVRAEQAAATCERIGAVLESERLRIVELLAKAGISPARRSPIGPSQRHEITIGVPTADARRAARALEADGYDRRSTWRRGAERSFWATGTAVTMERTGEATTVVELRWADPRPVSRLSRLVRPTPADWDAVDLPGWAWWMYPAIRPARLLVERLGRRSRGHPDLQPFLATPRDLIPPLLEAADVGEGDVLLDVGCGDGRIVIEAARQRGCRAIGVERSRALAASASANVSAAGLSGRVTIAHGDGLEVPLDDVTVVMLFLPMRVAAGVVPVLQRSLPSGARIWLHEQSPVTDRLPPPVRSTVVLADESLTVAHRWDALPER